MTDHPDFHIGLDFDGTVVAHSWPETGPDLPGAVETLRWLTDKAEAKITLFTMRSGEALEEAVRWFSNRGIQLFGVNHTPGQDAWTTSPKAYADLYIDDRGLGMPLDCDLNVDWERTREIIEAWLIDRGADRGL